jgi:glutamine amidotransferase
MGAIEIAFRTKTVSLVCVVDYGSGNLRSVAKAFERQAREGDHNITIQVTSDPDIIARADRVVLPGVGAFGDCARGVQAVDGLRSALEESVISKARPFFGICVGMQLMAQRGLEHGIHQGFGWIKGDIVTLSPDDPDLKIPHMGWNLLEGRKAHPVLDHTPDPAHAYFVHSYGLVDYDPADLLAYTQHGQIIPAMVARANMIGTQFHPEKSQAFGLNLIDRFLKWRP